MNSVTATALNAAISIVPTPYNNPRMARPTKHAPTRPRPRPMAARMMPSFRIRPKHVILARAQRHSQSDFVRTLRDGEGHDAGLNGYLDAVAERERHADVASLRHVFAPESVAVIGASRRPGTVGG